MKFHFLNSQRNKIKAVKNKQNKILLATSLIIIGYLLNAFAWITKEGRPISTICHLFGIGLIICGSAVLTFALLKK